MKRDFEKDFGYDSQEENELLDGGPDGIVLQLKRGLKNRRAKTKESLILASIQKAAQQLEAETQDQAGFMRGASQKGHSSKFLVVKRAVQANQLTAEQANEILMKSTKEENQGLIKRAVGENQAIKKLLDRLRPPSQEPLYRSQKMRT